MAKVQEIRIPLALEWASVARRGDTLIIGLADKDNVQQMVIVRPEGEDA